MPELPEVEHIVRYLRDRILGLDLSGAAAPGPVGDLDVRAFGARLRGRRIVDVRRRGKLVIIDVGRGEAIVFHLKMTGKLWADARHHPHTRLVLGLRGGPPRLALTLEDQRRFARAALCGPAELARRTASLGPEPLDPGFDLAALVARLSRRGRRAIKAALLDQRVVAGIGNIYADEILFAARLHPARRVATLSPAEMHALHRSVRSVLRSAVAARSGEPDQERVGGGGPAGRRAARRLVLAVYQRTGEPCPRCGAPVARFRLSGRGTHFCPRCQPAPAPRRVG